MENSAPVPESRLWELLLTWLLLQPPAGVSGATARTELLTHFVSVGLPGVKWLFVRGVPFLQDSRECTTLINFLLCLCY